MKLTKVTTPAWRGRDGTIRAEIVRMWGGYTYSVWDTDDVTLMDGYCETLTEARAEVARIVREESQ